MAQIIKKLVSLKFKFCFVKDIMKVIEKTVCSWEKIFANHISDQELVSKIHKEF